MEEDEENGELFFQELYEIGEKQYDWIDRMHERYCESDIVVIPVLHKDWLEVMIFGDDGYFYRFPISEKAQWSAEMEQEFDAFLRKESIGYSPEYLGKILSRYRKDRTLCLGALPEKKILLLGHIYHAMKKGTPKEILYKAGLDMIAAHEDRMEGLDRTGTLPAGIFRGISVKTLRALDSPEGVKILSDPVLRSLVFRLQKEAAWIFQKKLSESQAIHLRRLLQDGSFGDAVSGYRKTQKLLLEFKTAEEYWAGFAHFMEMKDSVEKIMGKDSARRYGSMQAKRFISDYYAVRRLYRCLREEDDSAEERLRENAERHRDLEYSDDRYTVMLPEDRYDYCTEGLSLEHCVASHARAVQRGDEEILFLRRTCDRNTPFITMEYRNGCIIQAHGKKNCSPPEDVQRWLESYAERKHIFIDTEGYEKAF